MLESRHGLGRLETLMDAVFGVTIVILVYSLPTPRDADWQGDSLLQFFAANAADFGFVAIGMVLLIMYWWQNSTLCEQLARTNGVHASLALVQIFLTLLYFYVIGIAMDFAQGPIALALQSGAAILVGGAAGAGWMYASGRGHLVASNVSRETVTHMRKLIWVEPITALITLPCSWLGVEVWSLAWLVYPLVRQVLSRGAASTPDDA